MSFSKETATLWLNLAKQNNLLVLKSSPVKDIIIDLAPGSSAIMSLGYNTHYDDFYISILSINVNHEFINQVYNLIYKKIKFPVWHEHPDDFKLSNNISISNWLQSKYPENSKFVIKDKDALFLYFGNMTNYINEVIPNIYNQTNSWEKIYNELFIKRNDSILDKWNSFYDVLFIKIGLTIALNNESKLDELRECMVQKYTKSNSLHILPKVDELLAILQDKKTIDEIRILIDSCPQNQELQFKKLVFDPQ